MPPSSTSTFQSPGRRRQASYLPLSHPSAPHEVFEKTVQGTLQGPRDTRNSSFYRRALPHTSLLCGRVPLALKRPGFSSVIPPDHYCGIKQGRGGRRARRASLPCLFASAFPPSRAEDSNCVTRQPCSRLTCGTSFSVSFFPVAAD